MKKTTLRLICLFFITFSFAQQRKTLKNTQIQISRNTKTKATYCIPIGNDSTNEWIEYVEFGGIRHHSGNNNGYKFFKNKTTTLTKENKNLITIKFRFESGDSEKLWQVWVDLNQNGVFDKSEEIVEKYTFEQNHATNEKLLTFKLDLSNAKSGITRMRIAVRNIPLFDGILSACSEFHYGEVEDYLINIKSNISNNRQTSSVKKVKNLDNKNDVVVFKTYPNPTANYLYISLPSKAKNTSYEIINCIGSVVKSETKIPSKISVSNLKSGIYFLKINDGQKIRASRFVKK